MTTRAEISDELIRELPSLQAALRACVMFSGLAPKAVAFELEIEASHLSKMLNPSEDPRHFPPNKIEALMEVCGNEIPLRWLLLRRGYPPARRVDALEREIERLRADNAELRGERGVMINVFKTLEMKE